MDSLVLQSAAAARSPVSFTPSLLLHYLILVFFAILWAFICSQSQCTWKAAVRGKRLPFSSCCRFRFDSVARVRGSEPVRAFFPNPAQEPILKEALKEPVAFLGGIFAGLLRLDLNEEPLKEWVTRTVEASGITAEGISSSSNNNNRDVQEEEGESPQEIEIE